MSPKTENFSPVSSEAPDLLLADIAIHIQISATDFHEMEKRYKAVSDHIDRPGSPLQSKVQLVYPQGSAAIGAIIASCLTNDEHDVDFVAQILSTNMSPKYVLDLLFESIRGEPGSRYHDKTERRTRCITVHYSDGMHADITPMVRITQRPERESLLFHNKPGVPHEDATLVANPYGFAEWFKKHTKPEEQFAEMYAMRAYKYERQLQVLAAGEEIPDQEPVHFKSKAVIVLQLIKRWRNVRYDKRPGRKPPSVMISKLVADFANRTSTLSEELLHQARSIRKEVYSFHRNGEKILIVNPACERDVLTDRWPESLIEQKIFLDDLDDLVEKLERLNEGCSLAEMKAIMTYLFGEAPTGQVFEKFNEEVGESIGKGRSYHNPDGGRLDLPSSGIVGGTTAKIPESRPTPRNTFRGEERKKKQ